MPIFDCVPDLCTHVPGMSAVRCTCMMLPARRAVPCAVYCAHADCAVRASPQAKTEDQLASERAWLDAEQVWLVHKDGFSAARLLRTPAAGPGSSAAEMDPPAPGRVRIRLQDTGETIEVDEDDIEKVGDEKVVGSGCGDSHIYTQFHTWRRHLRRWWALGLIPDVRRWWVAFGSASVCEELEERRRRLFSV